MTLEDPLRLRIIRYVQGLYEAAVDNPDPPEGKRHYGLEFSVVGMGPLRDTDARKRYVVGLVPGREIKDDLFPLKSVMLDLVVEFRVVANQPDEDPLLLAEQVMGVVQQIVNDDENFGGLIIKHDEVGNEQDMFSYTDRTAQGMVQFRIHYRHFINDVYGPIPDGC